MSATNPTESRVKRLVALHWLILAEPDAHSRKAIAARFGVSERQITKDLLVLDEALETRIIHTRTEAGAGYHFDGVYADRARAALCGRRRR